MLQAHDDGSDADNHQDGGDDEADSLSGAVGAALEGLSAAQVADEGGDAPDGEYCSYDQVSLGALGCWHVALIGIVAR